MILLYGCGFVKNLEGGLLCSLSQVDMVDIYKLVNDSVRHAINGGGNWILFCGIHLFLIFLRT